MPDSSKNLAADGFFQGFTGFDEAGEGGIHGGPREAGGMTQQRPVAAMDEHDDGGVGAGEVLGVADGAQHHVAGAFHLARIAADAAELVPLPPVHEAPGMGEDGGLGAGDTPADGAQVNETSEGFRQQRDRIVSRADVDGEDRTIVEDAQEGPRPLLHAQGVGHFAGDIDGFRIALVGSAHQVFRAPDRDEQGFRVGELFSDPGRVFPPRGDAVERG